MLIFLKYNRYNHIYIYVVSFHVLFVGKPILYVWTNVVVFLPLDTIHRNFQWTAYLCFA